MFVAEIPRRVTRTEFTRQSLAKWLSSASLDASLFWSEAALERELLLAHSHTVIAKAEGILAGFVLFHRIVDEIHILAIAIIPDKRRRHGASMLLKKVEALAHEFGCHRILLEVRETNTAARALYSALNYQIDGSRPRYYSDTSEAAMLMSKEVP